MKLYKPVLIESADLPMDKFPEGTIATHPDYWPVERCSCSRWESEGEDRYDPDMVGWTALVPIEAEKETARDISPEVGAYGSDDEIPEHYLGPPRTRYVTPWEEA